MISWKKYLTYFALFPFFAHALVVKNIEVNGLSRFSQSTVLVYSAVAVGDDIDEFDVKAIINNLFITDFFDDISVKLNDSGVLIINVKEKPVIANITFHGNRHLKLEQIEAAFMEQSVSVGRTFNQRKVESARRQLLAVYTQDGYYSATVDIAHTPVKQGRTDLKIMINEGPVATISKVVFHGNNAIASHHLMSVMNAQVTNPLSMLLGTNKYSQFALEHDTAAIEKYYGDKGYPDAKVLGFKASLNEMKSGIILDIFLEEGTMKEIVDIQIHGLDNFNIYDSIDSLPMVYSTETISSLEKDIRRELHNQGYFLQKITRGREDDQGKLTLHFYIHKGKPVYLNSIHITGNNKTREDIIRNHIALPEGSIFSAAKLEDLEDELNHTGFFDQVHISSVPLNDDSVDLNIRVEEARTKKISAGFSLSNPRESKNFVDVGGNFSFEDRNFLGTGHQFSGDLNINQYDREYSLSVLDPYALNNSLAFGYGIARKLGSYKNSQMLSASSVDQLRLHVGTNFKVLAKTSLSTRLQYSREQLPNKPQAVIDNTISLSGDGSLNHIHSFGVLNSLVTDTYNFFRFPTRGHKTSFSLYCNTPLSDFTFLEISTSSSKIFPLSRGFLWYSSLRGRYVMPYGKDSKSYIPSSHYLNFEGSQDVRGYAYYSTGPTYNNNVVEGNIKISLRNELVFPNKFLRLDTDTLRFSVFFDAGQVYRTYRTENIKQPRGMVFSTGLALRWISPILPPMSFSLNVPFCRKKHDGTQVELEYFSFSNMMEF